MNKYNINIGDIVKLKYTDDNIALAVVLDIFFLDKCILPVLDLHYFQECSPFSINVFIDEVIKINV